MDDSENYILATRAETALTGCGRNPCFVRNTLPGMLTQQAFCNCSREKLIEKILEVEAESAKLQAEQRRTWECLRHEALTPYQKWAAAFHLFDENGKFIGFGE